jgi:hypothetical protein
MEEKGVEPHFELVLWRRKLKHGPGLTQPA